MPGGEERAPVCRPLASPQNATKWPRIGRDGDRHADQLLGDLPETLIQAQNSPYRRRMKRLLLITLALWMSYFLVVNWFVHALNKIAVFGIPLGTCLAVQGAAIMFAVTLFRFARSAD